MIANRLENVTELHNNYYAFRHGKSAPNKLGIVVSTLPNGLDPYYGLTPEGQQQVHDSAARSGLGQETLILSSTFSRGGQTTDILSRVLKAAAVSYTPLLRERDFGEFELGSDEAYAKVWEEDAKDPTHSRYGVEPANDVQARVTSLIVDLEAGFMGHDIVLVSHGDPLQILQTGFQKVSAARHREMPHLGTAELRPLTLATEPALPLL